MGKLRALRLGIIKGGPSYIPLCPKEHDPDSLSRILEKKRYSLVLNRVPGAMDLAFINAVRFHAELCWPDKPKTYCDCKWCEEDRKKRQ